MAEQTVQFNHEPLYVDLWIGLLAFCKSQEDFYKGMNMEMESNLFKHYRKQIEEEIKALWVSKEP